jgi:hypothetical protein
MEKNSTEVSGQFLPVVKWVFSKDEEQSSFIGDIPRGNSVLI